MPSNALEKAELNKARYCQRCKWKYNNGDEDSARYLETNHCKRCQWELEHKKVESNWYGGVTVRAVHQELVPIYVIGDGSGGSKGGKMQENLRDRRTDRGIRRFKIDKKGEK